MSYLETRTNILIYLETHCQILRHRIKVIHFNLLAAFLHNANNLAEQDNNVLTIVPL
jgi:hypothetical protein